MAARTNLNTCSSPERDLCERSDTGSNRNGAVERTRTSTDCSTATSTLRVYQFRHDRTPYECAGEVPWRQDHSV